MTDHRNPGTPRSAERDLPGWLTANLPRIVKAVVHERAAQIPARRTLPRAEPGGRALPPCELRSSRQGRRVIGSGRGGMEADFAGNQIFTFP